MMDYLRWSKVHRRVRYELTVSGVPQLTWRDLGIEPAEVELEVQGTYGDPALIEAIARRYSFDAAGVVPVPGASSANFVAMACAAERGDLVVLEHPIYQPMLRVAEFLGFHIERLDRSASRGFEVAPEDVDACLRRGARSIVLTNLHNPSGQYIPPEPMRAIADACARAGATLVVDEVYLDSVAIIQRAPLWTAAHFGPHVIGLNSLTKVYGLAGLRIGWLLTGEKLAEKARTVMDLLSVNNAAPSSTIALLALGRMTQFEDRFRGLHRQSREVFDPWIQSAPALKHYPNYGAIFDCLQLPRHIQADELNRRLVDTFDTQVVAGSFFDLNDHIRLTPCALPRDEAAEGLRRLSACLRE